MATLKRNFFRQSMLMLEDHNLNNNNSDQAFRLIRSVGNHTSSNEFFNGYSKAKNHLIHSWPNLICLI
ncbi:MAG: hypothetical protein ACI9OI_000960 [Chitinophagales bacterium]|jgi:hypothetical protein